MEGAEAPLLRMPLALSLTATLQGYATPLAFFTTGYALAMVLQAGWGLGATPLPRRTSLASLLYSTASAATATTPVGGFFSLPGFMARAASLPLLPSFAQAHAWIVLAYGVRLGVYCAWRERTQAYQANAARRRAVAAADSSARAANAAATGGGAAPASRGGGTSAVTRSSSGAGAAKGGGAAAASAVAAKPAVPGAAAADAASPLGRAARLAPLHVCCAALYTALWLPGARVLRAEALAHQLNMRIRVPRLARALLAGAAFALCIEAVADWQKSAAKRKRPDALVTTGLYALCRHPNYLAELLFWPCLWGSTAAFGALRTKRDWEFSLAAQAAMLAVMTHAVQSLERWHAHAYAGAAYERYCAATPVLVPFTKVPPALRRWWGGGGGGGGGSVKL